jgi:hypothetical protein
MNTHQSVPEYRLFNYLRVDRVVGVLKASGYVMLSYLMANL